VNSVCITGFVDFVHHLVFFKEHSVSILDPGPFSSSGETCEVPTQVGPLEGADLNHWFLSRV
jgi:hypothetical protein